MIPLSFQFLSIDDEPPWPEVSDDDLSNHPPEIVILDKGMGSGHPSVAIKSLTSEGKPVVVQTSARLFCTVARAIMARYPELFDGV